jgi:surface antigen
MRKIIASLLIPATLSMSLAACDNQQIGTIAGAAGGAVAGKAIGGSGTSGTVGLIIGAVAGGYLGGEIGKRLSNRDKEQQAQATNRALENGGSQSWNNPETGARGDVTANNNTFKSNVGSTAGQICRDFSSSASTSDGSNGSGSGTACKQPDGTWKIVRQS